MAKKLARRLQRTLTIGNLSDEGDDLSYWLSKSPDERMEALEFLRQTIYGYNPSTARVQRILEIVELERS